MFDLIAGEARHLPRHPALPMVISTAAQAVLITTAEGVPMLIMTEQLPDVPAIMAFVAASPLPPPPPPPPAAPRAVQKPAISPRPVPASREFAPIDVPTRIEPEATDEEGFDEGAVGGVAGGLPGGAVGSVVGGLPEAVPPPPPPPAPASRAPVRVGGQIDAPALIRRVEAIYPDIAVHSHSQGVVILEAIVGEDGRVVDVKVARSAGRLLDTAALAAVRQWQYSPLLLNGLHTRFVLNVVLSFKLDLRGE
jgi:protein TonB